MFLSFFLYSMLSNCVPVLKIKTTKTTNKNNAISNVIFPAEIELISKKRSLFFIKYCTKV